MSGASPHTEDDRIVLQRRGKGTDNIKLYYTITTKSGKLLCVEGLIGAGKTTLCTRMQELSNNLKVIFEEVAPPEDLADFYMEPKQTAYKIQKYYFDSRHRIYERALKMYFLGYIVVMDRCVYTDKIFATLNRNEGNIREEDYINYCKRYDTVTKKLRAPDAFVVLERTPANCMTSIRERTERRRREGKEMGEFNITLSYLENQLVSMNEFFDSIDRKVIRFDWNNFGGGQDALDIYKKIFSP